MLIAFILFSVGYGDLRRGRIPPETKMGEKCFRIAFAVTVTGTGTGKFCPHGTETPLPYEQTELHLPFRSPLSQGSKKKKKNLCPPSAAPRAPLPLSSENRCSRSDPRLEASGSVTGADGEARLQVPREVHCSQGTAGTPASSSARF